jgi:patatin-like phospholipase/acyl hydrolase
MKRILSFDGGGIRGIFSLQILAAIEERFRRDQKRDDLVLAEVFDLFAGTSTGSIIAACLAWGMPVSEIEKLYMSCASEIFAKEHWYRRWKTKYRSDPIAHLFREHFCEAEAGSPPALLGSTRLRKLLLIVMRNASTGSPWPVSNNPHAAFNDPALPDCNLNVPLWQLLRASTAAPLYFAPEEIRLGEQTFLFVDGGMTPFNNPTLIALLMATLPPYRLCWPATRDELHVISIGTSCAMRAKLPHKAATSVNLLDALRYLAPALIGAISTEQDVLCRILGDCVYGAPIDSELKSLDSPTLLRAAEQKFTYVRYDQSLDAACGAGEQMTKAEAELDDLTLIPLLRQLGQDYAGQHVRWEHFFPR